MHGTEPQPVVRWLEDFHRVPKDSLSPYIYTLPREQAVRHAFRVASGLDSMVLGEPQILGQMKQAVRHAESAGSLTSPADAARQLQPQKYQDAFMDDYWAAWERRVERRLGPLATGR